MRRSLVSRIVALAIASLVGISAPGLAIAHGYAHHESDKHAEHERDHDRALVPAPTGELQDGLRSVFQATNEPNDHAHQRLAHALSVRTYVPLFVLPSVPVTIPVSIVLVSTSSLLLTAAPIWTGPGDAPPRQPRAPPLG